MNRFIKNLFTAALVIFTTQNLFSQIEITPFGGWHWTGKIPAWRQNIKVSDRGNYGIRGGMEIRDNMIAEFEWSRTENTVTFREYLISGGLGDVQNVGLVLNYYMLGFQYEAFYREKMVPYGLLNLGILNAQSDPFSTYGSSSDSWLVAGLGGGIKYFFTDLIGIRLQARLLLPMQFGGVGFGCGIGTGGGGCGAGVSTYTNIIQGDFTGGVILKLGD